MYFIPFTGTLYLSLVLFVLRVLDHACRVVGERGGAPSRLHPCLGQAEKTSCSCSWFRTPNYDVPVQNILSCPKQEEEGEDGVPVVKLAGDSLTACKAIGSTATTVEEAKEDPKVRASSPR